jgi:3D (Asp-Asp-Asp) domain-containing protein
VATAYGPPWGGINGNGITATGVNLTAGQPMYEIAVDPAVIPLSSYAHVTPNPFRTQSAFLAGDTGGAILGKHVDIYDWLGRSSQLAWGQRHVNVVPAAAPGAGNVLSQTPPPRSPTATITTPPPASVAPVAATGCASSRTAPGGPFYLTPGAVAKILPDGRAEAPAAAPRAVKLAIAAGNDIAGKPYPSPDVHFGSLAAAWPAYDCSGSASYVLYKTGLHSANPDVSGTLESWGAPGAGKWITVYANSGHTWVAIAGIAFDTSWSGNPSTWQPPGTGPRWRPNPTGNLADGLSYVVRHPPGL